MKKVLAWLDAHIEESICVVLLGLMSILIFIQVIFRYVLQASLSWSEEIARYLFIWLIYTGISYGVKMGKHISVDAVCDALPPKIQKYFFMLSDILFLIFSFIIIFNSRTVVFSIIASRQHAPATGIPMQFVYVAPFFGFILVAIRLIQSIINNIKTKFLNKTDSV